MDSGWCIARELRGRAERQHLGRWSLPLPKRRQIVSDAVERLPEPLRLVLTLRYCEGLGVRELAETLDLTPREVNRAISTAVTEIYRSLVRAEKLARAGGTG
jgi:DNA-directed RNA polymerase specialized sigma24 family protein